MIKWLNKSIFVIGFVVLTTVFGQEENKKFITITPGIEYQAGKLHRLIFGSHWRDVWATPVKVEVLNLDTFAGGLVPIKRGGGFATKSLRFRGNDGHIWKFRSISKDPSLVLPKELRDTFVSDAFQDQISSSNPYGALVAAPIISAAGILQAVPTLVYLPDDERLGEFREDFGNLLGMMEIHPDVDTDENISFDEALKVKSTIKLFKRLEDKRSEKIAAEEYLKARLLDILLGDWDRHTDQWKWAQYVINDKKLWKPIPRDRDQVFAKWDGLGPTLAEYTVPQFVHFDDTYPAMEYMTWSGRYLDRRILPVIERSVWDSITVFIQSSITDSVIETALRELPPEIQGIAADNLSHDLKRRRDNLAVASNEFYLLINKVADVYASNKDDFAEIIRTSDSETVVRLYKRDRKNDIEKGQLYYQRHFSNHTTDEIRIYLLEGKDKAHLSGSVNDGVLIKIIAGDGADELVDSSLVKGYFWHITPIPYAERKTIFFDSGKKTKIVYSASTVYNTDKAISPQNDTEKYEPKQKDRGHEWFNNPLVNYTTDDGFIAGFVARYYNYDFRAAPYDYNIALGAGYATRPNSFHLEFDASSHTLIKGVEAKLKVFRSGLVFTQFFGYGNETPFSLELEDEDYYRLDQDLFKIMPSLIINLSQQTNIGIGFSYNFSDLELNNKELLDNYPFGEYGLNDFRYISFKANIEVDSRDNKSNPYHGFYLNLGGSFSPAVLDATDNFSNVFIDVRGTSSFRFLSDMTFSVRGGGEKIFGKQPFFKSAFIGGIDNVKGFSRQRFSGKSSLFGQTELRVFLFPAKFLLQGKYGFHLLAESGRVFVEGEDSNLWHPAYGGGVWANFINRTFNIVFTIVQSNEKTGYYLTTRFAF